MRVLLDECLPRRLKQSLPGHEVRTVPEMGWASKKNGELLGLAATRFDVFLTVDRNLSYQQPVLRFDIALVVLRARGNRLKDLLPLVPAVLAELDGAVPGTVRHVPSEGTTR
ncbi:MAG: DUF5615 family PIN-like protein [Vicinamibacterales bacterium]